MTASFQDRDPDVRPADDLFRHVNGSWLSTTTIPNDQASTGSFRVLRDNSEAAVHDILEELTSGDAHELRQAASASTDHEVNLMAELYRRFMDSAAVEAVGTIPLTPILARIDRVTTISEFMTLLGQHYRESLGALFYLAEESDPADPTRYVPWMGQAGLGLPDEAYYRDDDKAEVREAYVSHVTRMLTLAGLDNAADQAQAVMDLETEIASHHWDQVHCRDMKAAFNPKIFDDLASTHPGLSNGAKVLASPSKSWPPSSTTSHPSSMGSRECSSTNALTSGSRGHAGTPYLPWPPISAQPSSMRTSTFTVVSSTAPLRSRLDGSAASPSLNRPWARPSANFMSPGTSLQQPKSEWTTSSPTCWRHIVSPSRH